MTDSRKSRRTGSFVALGGLFLLSGAAALIYEVIWFRLLILKLGGTGLAVATVTAAFMAGLGLGAWLFGTRWARDLPPILLYALLEGAVGAYALVVSPLVDFAAGLEPMLLDPASSGASLHLVRFLLAGAVLIPPTLCMGGTLPALARLVEHEPHRPGRFIGILYGLNTSGAVLGAWSGGFLLLPRLGFSLTVYLVALLNLALAGVAYSLSRHWGDTAADRSPPSAAASSPAAAGRPWLALLTYTMSGTIAFMLQISWSRILILVFASSVYAFSLILVIFLAGLGGGALAGAALLDRIASPRKALAWCFIVAGGTGLLGQALYTWLPAVYLQALIQTGNGLPLGQAAGLAALLMLPATLALGAGFPLVLRLSTGDERLQAAAGVGRLYAGNAAGSVVAAYATALFLIPALGLSGVVSLASYLALGMAILLSMASTRPRPRLPAPLTAALLLAVAWLFFVPGWNRDLMTQGIAFWATKGAGSLKEAQQALDTLRSGKRSRLLFYRDGVTATVAVKEETIGAAQTNRFLTIDGKIDASSVGDRAQQSLLAHLPLLARPLHEPDVLVIGYASGMTVASALLYPIKRLAAVEIEAQVINASKLFTQARPDPLEDARLDLIIDDARAYLERSQRKFDVIISSPSSPWLSGSAKLDTLDMYRLIRRHLKVGGIYSQYTQSYGLDRESAEALLRTLNEVFPHLAVFDAGGDVLLVLGSVETIGYQPDRLAEAWQRKSIRDDLRKAGIRSPLGLLENFVGDAESISEALPPGVLNTDDNAFIEYRGPKTVALNVHQELEKNLRAHSPGPVSVLAGLPPDGNLNPGKLSYLALKEGARRTAVSLARWSLDQTPDPLALWTLGEDFRQQNKRIAALERFNNALNLDPHQGLSLVSRSIVLQEIGREQEALRALDAATQILGVEPLILYYQGLAHMGHGQAAAGLAAFQEANRQAGSQGLPVPVEVHLAAALQQLQRPGEARLYLEAYLRGLPSPAAPVMELAAARERLAGILANAGSDPQRVKSLRAEASRTRRPLVAQMLHTALERLKNEGEASAVFYLHSMTNLDPGLQTTLLGALDARPAAQQESLRRLLESPPPTS